MLLTYEALEQTCQKPVIVFSYFNNHILLYFIILFYIFCGDESSLTMMMKECVVVHIYLHPLTTISKRCQCNLVNQPLFVFLLDWIEFGDIVTVDTWTIDWLVSYSPLPNKSFLRCLPIPPPPPPQKNNRPLHCAFPCTSPPLLNNSNLSFLKLWTTRTKDGTGDCDRTWTQYTATLLTHFLFDTRLLTVNEIWRGRRTIEFTRLISSSSLINPELCCGVKSQVQLMKAAMHVLRWYELLFQ